jgi:O-antigen/teichoic acid export membrane protein
MQMINNISERKLLNFILAFGLRLGAAFGPVFLTFLIYRFYSVSVVGDFTVALSVVLGVSLLSRFGMDQAIIRYAATNESLSERSGILTKILILVFLTSSLLILLSYPLLEFMVDKRWLNAEAFNFLKVMLWAVIPINFLYTICGLYKGLENPAVSVFFEYGIGCLWVSFFLFGAKIFFDSLTITILPFLFCGIFYCILFLSFSLFIKRYISVDLGRHSKFKTDKAFFIFSASLAVMSLSYFAQNVLVYVIGGAFLSSEALGSLRIITQVSTLISFPLVVINVFAPRKYVKLNKTEDVAGLRKFFRWTSLVGLGLAVPGILIIFLAGDWILSGFGVHGDLYLASIQILTVAQIVNVSTGSVGFLLTMSGNVHVARNILVVSLICGLCLYYYFLAVFGFIGSVFGLFFLISVPNIISYVFALRFLKTRSAAVA